MTISTASAPKYWQSTFLPTIVTGDGERVIDVLSERFIELLESITVTTPYTVVEGDKITTVCHQFYGTTSLYYLILYYNGLLFWDEVRPGDVIHIPSLGQINAFFGRNRQQIEQRVVI